MWRSILDRIPENRLEGWYSWMTFFAILLPLIGGFAGWAAWKLDDKIDDVKEASDKKEDADFQLQIARLNKEAGEARKDGAEAIKQAGELRSKNIALESDLLKLRASVEWRSFSPDEITRGIALLSAYSGTEVGEIDTTGDPESKYFSEELKTLLISSGWKGFSPGGIIHFEGNPTGVQIRAGSSANMPAAIELATFLRSLNISAGVVEPQGPSTVMFIMVLPKPPGRK